MKEIFYSNGVDIFGPVSLLEFSRNRYYKSTLIWYEGLSGWVKIGECNDLRHLIGTMSTPALDSTTPHSLPDLTPPLSKKNTTSQSSNKKYMITAVILFLVLLGLSAYYFNSRVAASEQPFTTDSIRATIPVVDSVATEHAELLRKAEREAEIKTHRINWDKFVIAAPNDYKQKEIGGIKDLKVIVKNTSPYKIDKVTVKVSYIKMNGDVYHTEMLDFDNVEANNNKELFAPESDRGVKVTCTIMAIKSTEMNLCLDKKDKDFVKKAGEDPFKCVQ